MVEQKSNRNATPDSGERRQLRWGPPPRDPKVGRESSQSISNVKSKFLNIVTIAVPRDHREVQESLMNGLMDSMSAVGLQNAIGVMKIRNGKFLLVAGRHRLEAAKRLGWPQIFARILDEDASKIWSMSENLHRAELTRLERAEWLRRYYRLRRRQVGLSAQPLKGGYQPANRGLSELARLTNIDRKQVRESLAYAGLSRHVKDLLRENGLDNHAKTMTAVAGIRKIEDQVAYIEQEAAVRNRRPKSRKKAPSKVPEQVNPKREMAAASAALWTRWEKLKFRFRLQRANALVRKDFVKKLSVTI